MQKIAFVDRDGTLIWEPERPEGADPRLAFPLKSPAEVQFMDGAIEGLQELRDKGYGLVLATNQPFLGEPSHPTDVFDSVMQEMYGQLEANDIHFQFVMVCPHGPDEGCDCRKPNIGGLKDFLEKNKGNIDFKNSLMFGDRETDGKFAENLGVRFVRIQTNKKFTVPEDV